jgi:hypothetical protein
VDITIQSMPVEGLRDGVIYAHFTLPGAMLVERDGLAAWLEDVEASLRAIPDLGAFIAGLPLTYTLPDDTTAVYVVGPITKAMLGDRPFITEYVVRYVVHEAERIVRESLDETDRVLHGDGSPSPEFRGKVWI